MESTNLPVGFGMALAMNEDAMKGFASMPESGQQAVIEKARTVSSRREMQRLVYDLSQSSRTGQKR